MSFESVAEGGSWWVVTVDGEFISHHKREDKALAVADTQAKANPDADVRVRHDHDAQITSSRSITLWMEDDGGTA